MTTTTDTSIIQLVPDIAYDKLEDIYYYTSFTNKDKQYLVMCQDRKRRTDWTCTCFDFMYRKSKTTPTGKCKHIQRVEFLDECKRKIILPPPSKYDIVENNDD